MDIGFLQRSHMRFTSILSRHLFHLININSMYRCIDIHACPGGGYESCALHYDDRMCAHCEDGYTYRNGGCHGKCERKEGGNEKLIESYRVLRRS